MRMNSPKVSVIIAVYNVEKYIERCARSLFSQTLDDLEFLFIDDCTPDNSINIVKEVLNEFPFRKSQTRFLKMETNSKQAAVRTKGILEAKGDYIIHCDPDDWIEPDMYEVMYDEAVKNNADIVSSLIKQEGNDIFEKFKIEIFNKGIDALKSHKVSHSLMNKLIRRSLLRAHKILPFPNINYGEDCNTVMRAYFFAGKVVAIDKVFYHYDRSNENAITTEKIEWLLDNYSIRNIQLLEQFFEENAGEEFRPLLASVKFATKSPLLLSAHKDGAKWVDYFPECHQYIRKWKEMPTLYRYALWLAANHKWAVKLIAKYLNRKN